MTALALAQAPVEDDRLIVCKDRDEWLAARENGIGSSESSVILGISPWDSPYSLWCKKTGITIPNVDTEKGAAIKRFGHLVEPVIAAEYERLTGRKLRHLGDYTIRKHASIPFMFATHDREIEAIDDRGPGLLSIKTCAPWKFEEWLTEPPLAYQVQIQHELAVSGYKWGSFAILAWGQPVFWRDCTRHDQIIETIEYECSAFWERVATGNPPPVDATEKTANAIKARFKATADGEVVSLDERAVDWHRTRTRCKTEIKALTTELRGAENALKDAIGAATEVEVPGGIRYTYRKTKRGNRQLRCSVDAEDDDE